MTDLSDEEWRVIARERAEQYFAGCDEADEFLALVRGMTLQEFRLYRMGVAVHACEDKTLSQLCSDIPVD